MNDRGWRWFPHPVLSLVLALLWMLLANAFGPGQIIMGALLGFLLPLFTQMFWEVPPVVRRYGPLFRLVPLFIWDVIVANIVVAILILSFWRTPRANWIAIPLDITNEYAILLLGSMITMTPGTVTAKLTPDRRKMLVHVLDTADPEAEIRQIKQRYERPLKEIFEC
jgi:multicomponent K+:H+ antiporter subunit E